MLCMFIDNCPIADILDVHSCSSDHSGQHEQGRHSSGPRSHRSTPSYLRHRSRSRTNERMEEEGFVMLDAPENEIEAQRMEQNLMVCAFH